MRLRAITTGINPRLGPAEVDEHPRPHRAARRRARATISTACAPRTTRDAARAPDAASPTIRSRSCGRAARPGMPKGAVFDHDNLRAVAIGAGAMGERFDRAPRAASVRARRVHVASVGGDREGHHDGHPADAVEGGRDARADGSASASPSARACRRSGGSCSTIPSSTRPIFRRCASRARARRRCRPSSCARWSGGSVVRLSSATRAPKPRSRPGRFPATRPR